MDYEKIGVRKLVEIAKQRGLPATFTMTKDEVIALLTNDDKSDAPESPTINETPEPRPQPTPMPELAIRGNDVKAEIWLDPETYAEVLLLARQASLPVEKMASIIIRQRFFGKTSVSLSGNSKAKERIERTAFITRNIKK